MDQKHTFCPNAAKNKLDFRILTTLKKKKKEKKNPQLLKTKGAAPKGHLLLPLLFLESKRCMRNEVGTFK